MESFGKLCLAGFTIVYGVLLSGFVYMKLWAWLILFCFPSLPNISLIGMIGLMMIWGALHHEVQPLRETPKEVGDPVRALVESLALQTGIKLTLLGFGYIITLLQ